MKQTGFRVNDEIYNWLKAQAEKEHRSVNNYLLLLILKEKKVQESENNEKL